MNAVYAIALAMGLATAAQPALVQAQASPQAQAPGPVADPVAAMDAQIKAMRDLREKMTRARTPEERRALAIEQRRVMQQSMTMMHGMMGYGPGGPPPGQGAGMGPGMGAGMGPGMSPLEQQRRMDMMTMMMQSMMDRLDQQAAPPAPRK